MGATYDNTTGVAQLWHNGKMVKSRNIGQIKLATQYPIRIGARDGDDRRFAGKISCLQIYDKALDEQQIGNLKSCPVKGNDCYFSSNRLSKLCHRVSITGRLHSHTRRHLPLQTKISRQSITNYRIFPRNYRQKKYDCHVHFSMFLIS